MEHKVGRRVHWPEQTQQTKMTWAQLSRTLRQLIERDLVQPARRADGALCFRPMRQGRRI